MRYNWKITALLVCIIVIGTILRIDNIATRTIGHVETYVPGIELPEGISDPRPRYGLFDYIARTIGEEPHPPAYYIFMFPWTKIFGIGLLSIRLPSVIFGILSILLIYILCTLMEDRLTAILAAGMLALNGLHIYWSQEAKMYSMACFLGLLSTILLVLILRKNRYQKILNILYVIVTLTGLTTVIYFWPIFMTQILWIFINSWHKSKKVPGILRFQFLVFILGSPLLAIAAFQSKRASYVEEGLLLELSHFFQFGFIFEPELYLEGVKNQMPTIVTVGMLFLAAFLLFMGLVQKRNQGQVKETDSRGPHSVLIISVGIICFLVILAFSVFAHAKDTSRTNLIIAMSFLPLILLIIDFLLKKLWPYSETLEIHSYNKLCCLNKYTSLIALLGIFPVLAVAGLSIIKPLFVARGTLIFVPYFLIILCRGMSSLICKSRLWIILLIVIAITHGFGVKHWQTRVHSPRNYKELYEKLEPKIQESDLIFVYENWAMSPIFYYMKEDHYNLIGYDYSQAIEENPNSRIWVLCLPGIPMRQEIKDAIKDYQLQERVDAFNMWSLLYRKNP